VAITTPAIAPPLAPERFITRSLAPCDALLNSGDTDSVNSAEPAISVQDQPRPRKNNPIPRVIASSALANPEIRAEDRRIATPI